MRYLTFLLLACTSVAHAAVISGQFQAERDGNGLVTGYPIQYVEFEVTEAGLVTFDILSYEAFDSYFDTWIWVFRDTGDLGPEDWVADKDDGPLGNDGSASRLDSYLERRLEPGRYLLAIDAFPSNERDIYTGFAPDTRQRITGGDVGDYQLTVSGGGIDELQFVVPLLSEAGFDAILRPLGDINDDGAGDLAVITPYGLVTIVDVNGQRVNIFGSASHRREFLGDAVRVPDANANGSPEIATLGTGGLPIDVIDSVTTEIVVNRFRFNSVGRGIDLEVLADMNGSGVAELISLVRKDENSVVRIQDTYSLNILGVTPIARGFIAVDLEVLPDINGDDVQEFAVLSRHEDEARAAKLEIRDPLTGTLVWMKRLSPDWSVLAVQSIADIDNDDIADVAVLRAARDDSRAQVALFSGAAGETNLGYIPLARGYDPQQMLTVPDFNGNGSDEMVVFGRSADGDQKAQVKDSATGKFIRALFYTDSATILDVAVIDDLNGNGSDDIAILARSTSSGQLRITVKDPKTGDLLRFNLRI